MKRASYREAIAWIADNDDTQFMKEEGSPDSVSLCLIADIFDVSIDKARADLKRRLEKYYDALDKELEEDGNMMVPLADKIG